MENNLLRKLKSVDTPINRTAVRVGAVLFSICATFFFCRGMIFIPVKEMIALTNVPLADIDNAQLQRMIQQRADSQIGLLLLVVGAVFSILSASLPVKFDDKMNGKGAIRAVSVVLLFFVASFFVSTWLKEDAYKKVTSTIKVTMKETQPTSFEKMPVASPPFPSENQSDKVATNNTQDIKVE